MSLWLIIVSSRSLNWAQRLGTRTKRPTGKQAGREVSGPWVQAGGVAGCLAFLGKLQRSWGPHTHTCTIALTDTHLHTHTCPLEPLPPDTGASQPSAIPGHPRYQGGRVGLSITSVIVLCGLHLVHLFPVAMPGKQGCSREARSPHHVPGPWVLCQAPTQHRRLP